MTDIALTLIPRPSYASKDMHWPSVLMQLWYHTFAGLGVLYAGIGHVDITLLYILPYAEHWARPVSLLTYAFAVVYFFLVHISIGLGAHKICAHKIEVEFIQEVHHSLALFFLAAMQGPWFWWGGKHVQHHVETDTENDPHSRVIGGFFHAHMGWLLRKVGIALPPRKYTHHFVKQRDGKYRAVWWQLRNYKRLSAFMAFGVPTLVCSLWGDPVGGLLIGGAVRLVVQFHCTWIINSVNHKGVQDESGSSAVNVPWLAVPTVGEAYHKNHHDKPMAWRMGRWDITAFVIMFLAWCGLAKILKPDDRAWEKKKA